MQLLYSLLRSLRGPWLQFIPGAWLSQCQIKYKLQQLHDIRTPHVFRLTNVIQQDVVHLRLLILQDELKTITRQLYRLNASPLQIIRILQQTYEISLKLLLMCVVFPLNIEQNVDKSQPALTWLFFNFFLALWLDSFLFLQELKLEVFRHYLEHILLVHGVKFEGFFHVLGFGVSLDEGKRGHKPSLSQLADHTWLSLDSTMASEETRVIIHDAISLPVVLHLLGLFTRHTYDFL